MWANKVRNRILWDSGGVSYNSSWGNRRDFSEHITWDTHPQLHLKKKSEKMSQKLKTHTGYFSHRH